MKPYDIHQTSRREKLPTFILLLTAALSLILTILNIDKPITFIMFLFFTIAVFYTALFTVITSKIEKKGKIKIRIPLPFTLKTKPFSFLTATLLVTWVIGGFIFIGSLFQIAKIPPIAGSLVGAILGFLLFMFVPQR